MNGLEALQKGNTMLIIYVELYWVLCIYMLSMCIDYCIYCSSNQPIVISGLASWSPCAWTPKLDLFFTRRISVASIAIQTTDNEVTQLIIISLTIVWIAFDASEMRNMKQAWLSRYLLWYYVQLTITLRASDFYAAIVDQRKEIESEWCNCFSRIWDK